MLEVGVYRPEFVIDNAGAAKGAQEAHVIHCDHSGGRVEASDARRFHHLKLFSVPSRNFACE